MCSPECVILFTRLLSDVCKGTEYVQRVKMGYVPCILKWLRIPQRYVYFKRARKMLNELLNATLASGSVSSLVQSSIKPLHASNYIVLVSIYTSLLSIKIFPFLYTFFGFLHVWQAYSAKTPLLVYLRCGS